MKIWEFGLKNKGKQKWWKMVDFDIKNVGAEMVEFEDKNGGKWWKVEYRKISDFGEKNIGLLKTKMCENVGNWDLFK